MNILKRVLTIFRDLLLLTAVCLVVAFGVYGMPLPYRSVFADIGPYQIQAFPTGLALFHPQRPQTPFYNFSPVNDYVVEVGKKVPLLSHDQYVKNDYSHAERVMGVPGIVETIRQYGGVAFPWYIMTTDAIKAEYVVSRDGQRTLVMRTVTFTQSREITSQTMTLWYNEGDVVTQPSSDRVSMQNVAYPGFITLFAREDQVITIDLVQRVVAVTELVSGSTSELVMSVEVRGDR